MTKPNRIGFVSTRLSGTDGVSLETRKWVSVLTGMGHDCFFFAGESDWAEEKSYVVPEAHFNHPDLQALNARLFDAHRRDPETSLRLRKLHDYLKNHLYRFLRRFEPQILIVENALSLPMNIPLGTAMTELIAEDELTVVAHHHDFAWERERYAVSAVEDSLRWAFPPTLPNIRHIVINSHAQRQLALNAGVSSTLIPNVMDFDTSPAVPDAYCDDLREELGMQPDEHLLLQPTRIVQRKRIEQSIELVRRLNRKSTLLITHGPGDEGLDYEAYLRELARRLEVKVLFASDRFAPQRGQTPEGKKIYALADAYHNAGLVTYPSQIEGFGNAFLETIYYRRPIMMSTYVTFKTDIQPKGFKIVHFGEFIDTQCVCQVQEILDSPDTAREIVENNYELGRQHYSYRVLEDRLRALLSEIR
jgi:glycosyltransferase involved in cell wall biosynthesis